MSLHTIAPEKVGLGLTETQERAIANFLYHFNGQYSILIVGPEHKLWYCDRDTTNVMYDMYWHEFEAYANIGAYGNHKFSIEDIYVLDELPLPGTAQEILTKRYVRHD